MTERRPLIEGLKPSTPIDPATEATFVYGNKPWPAAEQKRSSDQQNVAPLLTRVPISTRMRAEFANALKRASLERQLSGTEPNTLQDILEQAIEPWLRNNGYL
jgi:hypothetical protein